MQDGSGPWVCSGPLDSLTDIPTCRTHLQIFFLRLQDRAVILTALKSNVPLNAHHTWLTNAPWIASRYYRWAVPRVYVVRDGRVYISRTVMANQR